MSDLKKATLTEISADASAKPVAGSEIAVQFNPASLKLDLTNRIEGGDTRGRQNRQYLGKTSTTLTFDLHFDTADQGTPDAPVSVRTLTAAVERFVLPKGEGNTKEKPPKARFHWDELIIDGIIESVSIDFDLFAANGTPLRAKLGVAIKEQDAKYELLQSGPGANRPGNATAPGASGTGPGSSGAGPANSSATALAGESAAEFAARMGLDPTAWRGIAGQIGASGSLSLKAGAAIDFSSSLSAGAGIGIAAGVQAGASTSLGASFGLDAQASANPSGAVSADTSAGFALAAAGGVGAAIETVAILQAQSAADSARRSFGFAAPAAVPSAPRVATSAATVAVGAASIPTSNASAITAPPGVPSPSITPQPAMPNQSRAPLALGGMPSPSSQESAPSAPPPPTADPRATSFGLGVPLRPRVGSAADLRTSISTGRIPLRPRAPVSGILISNDPTAPPWTQLPVDAVQMAADKTQGNRYPARPCGCSARCNHGVSACR
jgi:Contractile injection system tube protein